MKKKELGYLMIFCILIVSTITYFGLLVYFKRISENSLRILSNPFLYIYGILSLGFFSFFIINMEKKVSCFLNKPDCNESLELLQKGIVKFPTRILLLSMVYAIILPQILMLGNSFTPKARMDFTLLSLANLLLIGIPFYIFFIRNFEDYCSKVPFTSKYLSMNLSIRTMLVTFLSLFSLSILIYLSIKTSSIALGISMEQRAVIIKTAAPLVIGGIIFTIICIFLLMSGINKRIFLSQHLVQNLAERDYSNEDSPIPSRDELGQLIHEINLVKNNTGDVMLDIHRQMDKTIEIKQNLIAVAEESSSAMTEMTSNIQSVGNSISNLDSNINEVTSSMTRLNQFILSLSNNMTHQVKAQEESTAAIEEMTSSIDNIALITQSKISASQKLQSVSDRGEEILKNTISQIGNIFESLENIKNMTKLILNISSQTNMLAMNAAIEAAHAGDAGKGFSVVADEIRKLAETSSANSKQINESIKDIVSSVESATESGNKTTQAFTEISGGIRETLDSLSEISTGMSELKTGGSQILLAVENIKETSEVLDKQSREMKEETEKVNNAAKGLSQISSESKIAMEEMAIGAKEVLDSSLSLNDEAAELDDASRSLKEKIDQFKFANTI